MAAVIIVLSGSVVMLMLFVRSLLARMRRLELVLYQLEDCWTTLVAEYHG